MARPGTYVWDDGVLRVSSAHLAGTRVFETPAEFAAARFACECAPDALEIHDGPAMMYAAFGTVPFAKPPLPAPSFGPGVTPAAREAFSLFAEDGAPAVLRAETDDFIVCARRRGAAWDAGAFASAAGSLTFRLEDLRELTPPEFRRRSYRADILRDAYDSELQNGTSFVRETLRGVAPDARIFFDHRAGGGFFIHFEPDCG